MPAIEQMKLMISLSQIDGQVADRERAFLLNIGRANGINEEEVDALIKERHPLIISDNLSKEEKFKYIVNLIQLMKIDERMYREEILFCSKIASHLGYDQQVMFDLMLHIPTEDMGENEMQKLEELTKKYLS